MDVNFVLEFNTGGYAALLVCVGKVENRAKFLKDYATKIGITSPEYAEGKRPAEPN